MKTFVCFLSILLVTIAWKAADILSDLSLTQTQLEQVTLRTAESGLSVPDWSELNLYPFVKQSKSLAAGSQANAVKAIGALVKSYVMSERFKKQWQQSLTERNIYDPRAKGDYVRLEELHKQNAEQQKSVAKSTKAMNDSQKQMAQLMKDHPEMEGTFKQQMSQEEWIEFQKLMKGEGNDQAAQGNKQVSQNTNDFLKKEEERVREMQQLWDENNYQAMIRRRLQKFIETANSVDFAAQVKKNKYNSMVFVNPDYEKKNDFWKQLYRAGNEPVMAAKEYAQQWLTELK